MKFQVAQGRRAGAASLVVGLRRLAVPRKSGQDTVTACAAQKPSCSLVECRGRHCSGPAHRWGPGRR